MLNTSLYPDTGDLPLVRDEEIATDVTAAIK
jgi:hypothetical protein